ncbi:RagB/SusD family nutrient uptake outer membrane protein [Persicobacter diffluens]|uniref:Membrane protein n=1 Tax=Persicobacter diffluens TaxID=981 RepID=A0AAN4VWM1_9BACT|nr:membrane protein [Persicobacter diffluens]
MNIRYKFIAVLLAVVSLSSCSNWLDINPEGVVPSDDIDFTDPSQMYGPVSGVYAEARTRMTQWEIWPILNVRGDEVTKGGGSAAEQMDYSNIENFNYAAAKNFWAMNAAWEAFFKVVNTTYFNEELLDRFLENLTDEADVARAASYRGEIVFHRALAYFYLHQLWGEIPLVDPENVTNAYLYKSRVENVRAHLHELLDYAIDVLPEQNELQGAVNKYTAMTLKAKLALIEGDFELVKSLTDEIINSGTYALVAQEDYYDLFKIHGKLSSESIYEFQFSDFDAGDGPQIYADAWFQHQGPRNNPVPITGWGFMLLQPEYLDFLNQHNNGERDEERWNLAVLESGTTTPSGDEIAEFDPDYMEGKAHYNGKAYTPKDQMTEGRPDYGTNNNVRVLRYADVLLMNAEVKARLGGDAATPLNLVRERVGLAPIASPTVDQILEERRAELSVEWGDRFNDLVRTGQAASVLPGYVAGESEYLPVPLRQEDLNPNLLQPAI